ncbi:hypothetical protein [Microcoleus sp. F4-D5]|uniref:hypothetical protein n=1 Tax=Microcoleus sp. F4-D5 TaxID=2818760 RepID=UPI002FD1EA8A
MRVEIESLNLKVLCLNVSIDRALALAFAIRRKARPYGGYVNEEDRLFFARR